MVLEQQFSKSAADNFQYSLCRVVLMVNQDASTVQDGRALSVLALSSRFDGHQG